MSGRSKSRRPTSELRPGGEEDLIWEKLIRDLAQKRLNELRNKGDARGPTSYGVVILPKEETEPSIPPAVVEPDGGHER